MCREAIVLDNYYIIIELDDSKTLMNWNITKPRMVIACYYDKMQEAKKEIIIIKNIIIIMISTRLSKTSHNNISLKVVYNSDLLFF